MKIQLLWRRHHLLDQKCVDGLSKATWRIYLNNQGRVWRWGPTLQTMLSVGLLSDCVRLAFGLLNTVAHLFQHIDFFRAIVMSHQLDPLSNSRPIQVLPSGAAINA